MPTADSSSRKIRVMIVDDIAETRDNVRKLLFFEDDIEIVAAAADGKEGVELAGKLLPDIVLMDINMPGMDGIAASEAIAAQFPQVQVVMMSVQGEADYLRRSMLAGAREFLIKPFSSEDLTTSIRRVHKLAASRRVAAPPPVTTPTAPLAPLAKGGTVISVFGSKGGCGATTLTVNLAVALREETRERVALVDANFEFGDIGVLLNLPTNRTIADLTGPNVIIDEESIDRVMATHPSGVKALLAPPRPEMSELVSPEHIKKLLEILPKMFDYVLIDIWRTFQGPMISLLDASDQVILVATNDIPSIKNAKLFFELSDALGYASEKICLVLNKDDGRTGIDIKDVEASIKHPVRAVIPKDERTNSLAINRGIPFVQLDRKLPITQTMFTFAKSLVRPREVPATPPTPAAAPPEKLGWLRRR